MIQTVSIGAITLNQDAYPVTGAPGLELPSVRFFSYDLPGANFGIFTSAFYGRRAFALQGMVIGSDAADFIAKRDELIAACDVLSGPQEIGFTLSDGTSKRITAVLKSLDLAPQPGVPAAAPFSAAFEAAFPYLESTTEHSQTTGLALAGGGKVPPDTMPAAIGKGSGGAIAVSNAGTAPAYPTARITGPVSNPAIHNDTTSEELSFSLTLAAGEFIEIDFERKTVIDHTGRNRYAAKEGDWFQAAPGSSAIRFIADSIDTSASLTLAWRDTYLNL